MNAIEIARAFAARQEVADTQGAYALVLQQADGSDPAQELEAAAYLFDSGANYKVPYTTFHSLYNRGYCQDELFDLMVGAFYAPNVKEQERRYQKNCKLLGKYKYLFRQDFPAFDDLPVKFFPFDDDGFLPFDTRENRFGDYVNYNDTVIDRNFFADLEKPILAQDVFSQYQLEYLNDNVRRSDWAARENHIYLHYTDWAVFCSHLQVLNVKELLKDEKLVFMIEGEETLYPIDFKARFGIDYSQNTVKPFSVREVTRLIWHTQLATHNGGDFFNEIFYGHPNLLAGASFMFHQVEEQVRLLRQFCADAGRNEQALQDLIANNPDFDPWTLKHISRLKAPTDKDFLVALFMGKNECGQSLDPNSRIAPAFLFQPHFSNVHYTLATDPEGRTISDSNQYQKVSSSPLLRGFKYIKTFTPMRRITTSCAASVKFMYELDTGDAASGNVVSDLIFQRVLNRSFMYDWQDRLYRDSILVRFEDGKLNPRATFTALTAFLDLPYTESMTYCSDVTGINPESLAGNAVGFDPSRVYEKYNGWANDTERAFLEYFLRDAYKYYGYDMEYYHGESMDAARAEEMISGFTTLEHYIVASWKKTAAKIFLYDPKCADMTEEQRTQAADGLAAEQLAGIVKNRQQVLPILLRDLKFINRRGQPLKMMTPLHLDPALLEAPLYH